MSRRGLARHNAKRDENEPEIRKRFAAHGWHTEQVSGKGMPDLLVFLPERMAASRPAFLVDVKMPDGTLTKAQKEKWPTLHKKGIPVYVVRTAADVDALVGGTLEPWRPMGMGHAIRTQEHVRAKGNLKPSANYAPPPNQSTPRGSRTWPMATTAAVPSEEVAAVARAVLAAHEAGETFAPEPLGEDWEPKP